MSRRLTLVFALVAMFFGARSASAQAVFGTFPWQMQPYCNRVTLTLISMPTGFTLEGVDDQCGATSSGSAIGTASFNGAGNVVLSFTIVTPGARPVHVSAVVSPANGNGTWTDSNGRTGTFAFFGNTGGLPPLPVPATQVRFRARGHNSVASLVGRTTVLWSQVQFNDGGGSYNTGNGTYTVGIAGNYIVSTTARWPTAGATTGYVCVFIDINGSDASSVCQQPSTTANYVIMPNSSLFSLNAGDTIRIDAFTSGNTSTFGSGSTLDTHFSIIRVP